MVRGHGRRLGADHEHSESGDGGAELRADLVDTDMVNSEDLTAASTDEVLALGASPPDLVAIALSAAEISDVSADANLTSADWGDYELQKDGTDGTGIINFKTK